MVTLIFHQAENVPKRDSVGIFTAKNERNPSDCNRLKMFMEGNHGESRKAKAYSEHYSRGKRRLEKAEQEQLLSSPAHGDRLCPVFSTGRSPAAGEEEDTK